jgi:hypothetical protein
MNGMLAKGLTRWTARGWVLPYVTQPQVATELALDAIVTGPAGARPGMRRGGQR